MITTPLKIETGIPLPDVPHRAQRSPMRVAFEQMQVGQSVQIGRKDVTIAAVYGAAKKSGIKVATRLVNCEGRRIWRIA